MFIIRTEQIDSFEQASSAHFPGRLLVHLRAAFPKHCELLGDDGVHEVINYAVERCVAYGFTKQSSVSLFVDLTMLLGREFHMDPQLPWASDILTDISSLPDELLRAERLHAAAMEYLDSVSGTDNEFIDAAQRRLLEEPLSIATGSTAEFVEEVCRRLERIWPEKYGQLNETSRAELFQHGVRKAGLYKIGSETGAFLSIAMMYMLGVGYDRDPMFAWAGHVLSSPGGADEKIANVYTAAMAYLARWCGGDTCHV